MDKKKPEPKLKINNSVKKTENLSVSEKTNDTGSSSTIGKRKKNPKQEWEKYFCYINDKDREQMMKLPDLPQIKSKKKKKSNKNTRSKSLEATTSPKPTKDKLTTQQENQRENIKLDIEMEKNPIAVPHSTLRTKTRKINTVNDDKKNNSEISDNMNSLHSKPAYRYLIRSMKANM